MRRCPFGPPAGGRKILVSVALLFVLPVAAIAAEPGAESATEPESTFTDQIEVNLVDLNVVVTTFWGRPITGLTRDDFEVFEDGEPREISHFTRVIDGVPDSAGDIAMLPGEAEVPAATAQPAMAFDRSIILAFDAAIQRPYFKRALKAARNFVGESSGERIWWSVVVLADRPYSVLPLTGDVPRVVAALDAMLAHNAEGSRVQVPVPAVAKRAQLDGPWCRLAFTEQSLAFPYAAASLSEIFRAYASVLGAKSVVVYQQGMGGGWVNSAGGMLRARSHIELWRDLGRQATSAGFKVYAMDVLGLNLPGGVGSGSLRAMLHQTPSISVANYGPTALARDTGGDFFALNHLDEAVKAAAREMSTYYTLAFVAPHGHDGEAHDVKVAVRGRPWLEVRHSSGFFDVDPRTLLVEHLASPAYFPKRGGELPVRLEVAAPAGELIATAAAPVEHLTLVPEGAARVAEVDFFVAVHDESGALVSLEQDRYRIETTAGGGEIELAVPVRRPETAYSVTVALYDPVSGLSGIASERVGDVRRDG